VVTAAPVDVPEALLDQLAPGGRLVIPLGDLAQTLYVYTNEAAGLRREAVASVRFVPLRRVGPPEGR
jgi:protein-L-isoaspartate(D-aspartate) O-methyltransferase